MPIPVVSSDFEAPLGRYKWNACCCKLSNLCEALPCNWLMVVQTDPRHVVLCEQARSVGLQQVSCQLTPGPWVLRKNIAMPWMLFPAVTADMAEPVR